MKKGFVFADECFDNQFKCFMSGELVTIIAEANSGKTTFAMDMITRNVEKGRKCLYINLEFAIETVWQNKWLWQHGKDKTALTDINPLTEEEKEEMDKYVEYNISRFDNYSNPKGISLKELKDLIGTNAMFGTELVVIDSFSRIEGNLGNGAYESQNRCMEELQELAQKLDIAIVMLHHTKRDGSFEGSQKIMDLSNMFIFIEKQVDAEFMEYRTYKLLKDKYTVNTEIDAYYKGGQYLKL